MEFYRQKLKSGSNYFQFLTVTHRQSGKTAIPVWSKTCRKWGHWLKKAISPVFSVASREFSFWMPVRDGTHQEPDEAGMYVLRGKGGEGKSRVGVVLQTLLGCNLKTGSITKVEISPFARADLQNMLVMLDDDMKMEALTQTNNIKAIVTAELPMDLEKKGQQSYQADMRVRFLALGNGRMQALHDRSYGFFRRQILLEAKEQSPDRRDDPYLAQRLCAEKEGIFLWAFAGLQRLVANDFHFTLSQQAKENMEAAIAEGNNLVEFMKSEGYFRFQADSEVSSRDFYTVYLQWCMDNALSPLAQKTVINYLKQNSRQYNLEYTNKISIGDGRFARGFWGIRLLKK